MRTNLCCRSSIFTPRVLFAFSITAIGMLLAGLGLWASPRGMDESVNALNKAALSTALKPVSPVADGRPSVSQPQQRDGTLRAITCTSDSDCWAVGYREVYGDQRTLAQHWNGTFWSVVDSPNPPPPGFASWFDDVTCVSASDCWAVGAFESGGQRTLIEHWDGASWSIVNSANPGQNSNWLHSVTCSSTSDCWAVGFSGGGIGNTLIEHWNGASWLAVSSPSPGAFGNELFGVACASPSDCWAVGTYFAGGSGYYRPLIERWDGTSWSMFDSPTPAGGQNILRGIACTSLSQCWAIGNFDDVSVVRSVIEKWDGSQWTIVDTRDTDYPRLTSLACASASECWAVGSHCVPNMGTQTMTVRCNGMLCSVVDSPTPPGFDLNSDGLFGVGCASTSDCWAVGHQSRDTLTEHWDGNSWAIALTAPTLNGVVSRKVHGSAGVFDIDLPVTGNYGRESRSGGPNGDYQLVLTFGNDVTSIGSAETSVGAVNSAAIGPNSNQCTVNTTGILNAYSVTVTVNSVQDTTGNSASFSITMNVLVGDTNDSGSVNATDIAQAKSQIGQSVDATNFRSDVNANGIINASDVAIVKSSIGTALP